MSSGWNLLISRYRKAHDLKIKDTMKILSTGRIYTQLSTLRNFTVKEFIQHCPGLQHIFIFYENLDDLDKQKIVREFGKDWTFDMIGDLNKYLVPKPADDPNHFPFDEFA